jgi:hypothetical protein
MDRTNRGVILAIISLLTLLGTACGSSPTSQAPAVATTSTAAATMPATSTTTVPAIATTESSATAVAPSGHGLPGPTQESVPASDPDGAAKVAHLLYPDSGFVNCSSMATGYSNCPVTDRLANRLDQQPLAGSAGGAEPVCRCQNSWTSVSVSTNVLPSDSTMYIAHVVLNFGSAQERFDVSISRSAGGWFANDISCTGRDPHATSIYAASPPPCG